MTGRKKKIWVSETLARGYLNRTYFLLLTPGKQFLKFNHLISKSKRSKNFWEIADLTLYKVLKE